MRYKWAKKLKTFSSLVTEDPTPHLHRKRSPPHLVCSSSWEVIKEMRKEKEPTAQRAGFSRHLQIPQQGHFPSLGYKLRALRI